MKKALLCVWLLLTLLTSVSIVYAKGTPEKISIKGTGLVFPLEITKASILESFDPWDGQFFDRSRGIRGRLTESPMVTQTYDIFFFIRDNDNKSQIIYSFRYALNSSGTQGYIYIPTEGEDGYITNSETIARPSGWYFANREWDKLMRQAFTNKSEAELNSSLTPLRWGEMKR